MGRSPRLQYDGALYHVINRGNFKRDIFETGGARRVFEECLFEGITQMGWRLYAHAIMRNHFHLAVETPRPNLAEGMQWIQSTFAARFIRYRSERGHLFEGRYKSPLLEGFPVLLRVVNYIHLNPVRAGIVDLAGLKEFRWGSRHWFSRKERPAFLHCAGWQRELGIIDDAAGWQAYENHLGWRLTDAEGLKRDEHELTRGWAIGSPSWKRKVLLTHRTADVGRHRLNRSQRRELDEPDWHRLLQRLLTEQGNPLDDRKSAPWKIEVAWALRQSTNATNDWITQHLHMGSPDSVSASLSRYRRQLDPPPNKRGLAPNV